MADHMSRSFSEGLTIRMNESHWSGLSIWGLHEMSASLAASSGAIGVGTTSGVAVGDWRSSGVNLGVTL